MKTFNFRSIALSIGLATLSAQAALNFQNVEFGPLQPVPGKSGKTVTVSATLYGKFWNTETRRFEYIPLATAPGSVTFEAFRSVNRTGTALVDFGPVGRATQAAPGSRPSRPTCRQPPI